MKNYSYISQNKGQSLIELSVSLFVASLVFLMAFPALRTAVFVGKKSSAREELRSSLERAEAILTLSFTNSKSFYPLQTIKVSDNGARVSFLHLDMHNLFRGTGKKQSQQFDLCLSTYNDQLTTERKTFPKAWLGITPYGAVELTGRVKRQQHGSECKNGESFRGSFTPRIDAAFNQLSNIPHTINPEHAAVADIKLLLPINNNFELSVDENRILRFKSNLSSENQPMIFGITSLGVTTKKHAAQALIYDVTVQAENRLGKRQTKELRFTTHSSNKTSFADIAVH